MKKAAFACLLAVPLVGCGVAARYEARTEYEQSAAAYKACLATGAPQNCEGQRLAMETDERKYTAIGAGTTGRQGSGNLTVLNR